MRGASTYYLVTGFINQSQVYRNYELTNMSRTYRKDKEGNKFPEGNPLRDSDVNYRCRCEWCTGIETKLLISKISYKEMRKQVLEYHSDVKD